MPVAKRLRGKTPDPDLHTKSPNPKKLKRAEKKLLKKQQEQRDGSSASTPAGSGSASTEGLVTPQGKLRKKLSFEVKNNEVFDIQAENKAPCPEKKRLAVAKTPAMSINEADEILKTMHTDLA